jgi:hypothetical protein
MTVSATEFLPTAQVTTDVPSASYKSLTHQAQREIERLTERLFLDKSGLPRKSVLMAEVDTGRTSSLWLATGVASVLGKALHRSVHVLSVGNLAPDIQDESEGTILAPAPNSCILERIADASSEGDSAGALTIRLSALQTSDHPVIVHLPHLGEQGRLLPRMGLVEGVVLLIRASQTRRAALEAIERHLATEGTQVLGSVLLDRVHPIPEKLYRLL